MTVGALGFAQRCSDLGEAPQPWINAICRHVDSQANELELHEIQNIAEAFVAADIPMSGNEIFVRRIQVIQYNTIQIIVV